MYSLKTMARAAPIIAMLVKNSFMVIPNICKTKINSQMPAVIMEKGTHGVFNNCFIKGNALNTTIGFAIKDANCLIESCKIVSHQKGGVVMVGGIN